MTRLLLTLIALLLAALPAAAGAATGEPHLSAQLLVATASPRPSETVPLGIAVDPGKGWHIYWLNPGESGYAPRFDWKLPTGYLVDPLGHPAPERIEQGGIAMNVHTGRTVLTTALHVPEGARPGEHLRLSGTGDFLVCSDEMCVPRWVAVSRELVLGDGTPDAAAQTAIAAAEGAEPQPLAGDLPFTVTKGHLRVELPFAPPPGTTRVALFSAAPNEGALGQARIAKSGAHVFTIEAATGSLRGAPDHWLVAVATGADGVTRAWRFHAVLAPPAAGRSATGGTSPLLAIGAIGSAILGGLLLNLMPCVFPILSLKAMALLRAGGDLREARAEALGYLAGAVGVMMALGGTVLALRAGGAAVGWAFQLQDPRVVALLLLLVVAIATNLAGLFELPSLRAGGLAGSGFAGGLGTGALAAFVATPCTGPFMAGALGAALVLPAPLALGVFAGLGLGLALPFLLIGLWEPARRMMPRPGAWMATLRRLLSVPMFATALGLAWLLGQQAGVTGMTLGVAGALVLGLGLWWWGLRQHGGAQRRGHGWPALASASLAALLVVAGIAPGSATRAGAAATGDGTVPYSASKLASLRAEHKPVLLYATAAWCLTCKVNEASSLEPTAVRNAFRRAGAVMMEADWTRNDPAVTRLLTANGRAGVPLYLWYPATGAPRVLPQVLTPALITGLAERITASPRPRP